MPRERAACFLYAKSKIIFGRVPDCLFHKDPARGAPDFSMETICADAAAVSAIPNIKKDTLP
ncbi:MAG: hypothetical protein DME38_00565 [Verrucomicrobia bacterium]|nr:MAG: hypothetical protein DME38_00565 [Verrucomicrobiota bacterium]